MEENIVNTITNSNYTSSVTQALDEIMRKIFLSIDDNVYELLDKMAFIDDEIISTNVFDKITNNTSGILLICNSLILGIIIFYSINYLFSQLFISKTDSPSPG